MIQLNDKNFHRALKQPRLIVMFSAAWAGPCNLARPVYAEVAESCKERAAFAEFDIDDNPITPEKYGIRALPTFMLFESGVPSVVKAGAIPSEAIHQMVVPPEPVKKTRRKV